MKSGSRLYIIGEATAKWHSIEISRKIQAPGKGQPVKVKE
jgi:hypothetical protein